MFGRSKIVRLVPVFSIKKNIFQLLHVIINNITFVNMQSKAAISNLIFVVYMLMLVHTYIPHSHCIFLQSTSQTTLTKSDSEQAHRLHHQMPQHSHLRCCEYYLFEVDDDSVAPECIITPYPNNKPVQAPVPTVDPAHQASNHYILPRISSPVAATAPLRAPPAA